MEVEQSVHLSGMRLLTFTIVFCNLKQGHVLSLVSSGLFIAGKLQVVAEFNTKDNNATGSVDFVVLLDTFVISVLEVRLLCCVLDANFL